MYNDQEPQDRFDDLNEVISYAAKNPTKFSAGERIMINQERGRLLAKIAGTPDDRPPYKVNARLETKIREALAWIRR